MPVRVESPYLTSITRNSNSTDKPEVDGALILLPSLHQCSDLRYLKLIKATQKGKKSKQGCEVTGDRTRDLSHRRPRTNQLCHPFSLTGKV